MICGLLDEDGIASYADTGNPNSWNFAGCNRQKELVLLELHLALPTRWNVRFLAITYDRKWQRPLQRKLRSKISTRLFNGMVQKQTQLLSPLGGSMKNRALLADFDLELTHYSFREESHRHTS